MSVVGDISKISPESSLPCKKYRVLIAFTAWRWVQPFRYNTWAWRTDGRTAKHSNETLAVIYLPLTYARPQSPHGRIIKRNRTTMSCRFALPFINTKAYPTVYLYTTFVKTCRWHHGNYESTLQGLKLVEIRKPYFTFSTLPPCGFYFLCQFLSPSLLRCFSCPVDPSFFFPAFAYPFLPFYCTLKNLYYTFCAIKHLILDPVAVI